MSWRSMLQPSFVLKPAPVDEGDREMATFALSARKLDFCKACEDTGKEYERRLVKCKRGFKKEKKSGPRWM